MGARDADSGPNAWIASALTAESVIPASYAYIFLFPVGFYVSRNDDELPLINPSIPQTIWKVFFSPPR